MAAHDPWSLAVDFGTSSTVVAAGVGGDEPTVVEVDGQRRTPSVVVVDGHGEVVVGTAAEALAAEAPERAVRAPKARLGDPAPVVIDGHAHRIVDLVAAVLAHVAAEATRQFGGPPRSVHLTHPAGWGETRRTALLEAAVAAGLPGAELVPEPVAAALGHGRGVSPRQGHVLVHDLGGGTFDAAAVRFEPDGPTVIGRPEGLVDVGGDLLDELLVSHLVDRLHPGEREALQWATESMWVHAAARLRLEARRAKEHLSTRDEVDVVVGLPSGMTRHRVTRAELEALARAPLTATVDVLARVAALAGLGVGDVAGVLLVGGASRMPLVGELVAAGLPGVTLLRPADPKAAVALGAVPRPPAITAETPRVAAPAGAATAPVGGPRRVPGGWPAAVVAPAAAPAPVPVPATGPFASVTPAPPRPRRFPAVAAAVTTVALLGAGAVLAFGGGGGGDGDDDDGSTRETIERVDADDSTTTTTEGGGDSTTTAPPVEPEPGLRPATQGDLDGALIRAPDVGPGFVEEVSEPRVELCNAVPAVVPVDQAEVSLIDAGRNIAVNQLNAAFADSAAAATAFEDANEVVTDCPTSEIVLGGATFRATAILEPEQQLEDIRATTPASCEDVSAASVLLDSQDPLILDRFVLSFSIRCGQVITTVQLSSSDTALLADPDLTQAASRAMVRASDAFAPD